MRKLVDNNLIKVIDTMSESPYEEYNFYNTPMTGFQIAQGGIDHTSKHLIIDFEGKIEPYTTLNLNGIDAISNIGSIGIGSNYVVKINLPEIITKPFEIHGNLYFDDEPGDINIYVRIPESYGDNLPLALVWSENKLEVKQWQLTNDGQYSIMVEKPASYTSKEEGWILRYAQGMFYLSLSSL